MWQQWLNAILGLWVMAVPFINFTDQALMWALAITGLIIVSIAAWGASAHQREIDFQAAMT